jgi:hypothetical protein
MPGKMARSDPRPSVRITRGAGSGQHLASVLQENRENAIIDAGLGFIWRISVKNNTKHVAATTEYVLVYAKDLGLVRTGLLDRSEKADARFGNPDNDPDGRWKQGDLTGTGADSHRTLKRGDPIFMFWLADISDDVPLRNKGSFHEIPAEMVTKISGNFTTAYQVQKQTNEIKNDMTQMKTDIGELKSFRTYVYLIIGLMAIFLFPTIRDSLINLLKERPATEQSMLKS